MKQTVRLGRIMGVDVGAHWSLLVLGFLLAGLGVAEWIGGQFTGLWLVLIGFVIVMAVEAESRTVRLRIMLGTTPVKAVMTPPPVVAYAGMPVERFVADVVPRNQELAYPVVDLDGHPTGTITLRRLVRVPSGRRASTRLADVQRPLRNVPVAHPDDLLADLISRMAPDYDELALVLDHDRLVGAVRGLDVARTEQLVTLHPVGQEPSPI
jgi:CBS domain-containing protein